MFEYFCTGWQIMISFIEIHKDDNSHLFLSFVLAFTSRQAQYIYVTDDIKYI